MSGDVILFRGAMRHRPEQERVELLVSEYGAERVRRDHLGMLITNPRRHPATPAPKPP